MKKFVQPCLIAAAIFSLLQGPAQAQTKIATVDQRKVFDSYYKTKHADTTLKEEATALEKEAKDMYEAYKKRESEWKKLLDMANDQAISAAEREKSKQNAEKKLLELQQNEQAIRAFERSAREKMDEKQRIKRDAILGEIHDVVQAKAKAAGYNLVIDSSASAVIYAGNENDLTQSVLSQLNAAAPALAKPEESKKESK